MRGVHEGGCLCGAVRYRVAGALRDVIYCHCSQCRRASGHHVAATACAPEDLSVTGEPRWHRSSDEAQRGFCPDCGSNLFWKPDHGGHVSIMAGTLDGPTGLRVSGNWHGEDRGDYYDLPPVGDPSVLRR
ncbi:GFA family protein [Roseovarius sp. C7]|uniref:GFA family protein n=1 Tax=Roseovarius sp. C7 TaxID=3398643 RepID=UPI0039F73154